VDILHGIQRVVRSHHREAGKRWRGHVVILQHTCLTRSVAHMPNNYLNLKRGRRLRRPIAHARVGRWCVMTRYENHTTTAHAHANTATTNEPPKCRTRRWRRGRTRCSCRARKECCLCRIVRPGHMCVCARVCEQCGGTGHEHAYRPQRDGATERWGGTAAARRRRR
jgi:hypothetical protein